MDPVMDIVTTRATTIYKPSLHKHPLSLTAQFMRGECGGCHVDEPRYESYYCNESYECDVWFHKECGEAPMEINHPSHLQHPIRLTNDSGDGPCDFCGQKLQPPCYSCSTCGFKVDFACGMKPPLPSIEHPLCHDHPLIFFKKRDVESICEVCIGSIGGSSYSCLECVAYFHRDCVHLSREMTFHFHSRHPLKLIATNTLTNDGEKTCHFCEEKRGTVVYHCSICIFTMCLQCTRNPPPFVIEHIKTHKHPLTLLFKKIHFTCNICGVKSEQGPYVCLQCAFVIHVNCIGLPRVININRHDHRISFIQRLGFGYSQCGVCWGNIDYKYGAYTCYVCPNYATHVHCSISFDVWDHVELEGTPDDIECIAPFKMVGDNLIEHFSHKKHPLKLYKDYILNDEWVQCEGCTHPLGFDPIYRCEECPFVLHERCASLPMKKRFAFDIVPYTLEVDNGGYVDCLLCRTLCDGFLYRSQEHSAMDSHCGSFSEPVLHHGHLHPLCFVNVDGRYCFGCHNVLEHYFLSCNDCIFDLCLYCASLPKKMWHMNNEHPLTLYCGGKMNCNNWCDNCEMELDLCTWFYTCTDCEVTFHARCVLGDFSRLKIEDIIEYGGKGFKVVSNNHNTRPLCSNCHIRCKASIILKCCDKENNGFICSRSCLRSYLGYPDPPSWPLALVFEKIATH